MIIGSFASLVFFCKNAFLEEIKKMSNELNEKIPLGAGKKVDLFLVKLKEKFEQHLEWLRPLDPLERATGGFEAAIKFMMETDNTNLLGHFWEAVNALDWTRNESLASVVPELEKLRSYEPDWAKRK